MITANSEPAISPGLMSGNVIRKNVAGAEAPRSCAASSSERLNPDREASVVRTM